VAGLCEADCKPARLAMYEEVVIKVRECFEAELRQVLLAKLWMKARSRRAD
jgi:hypothetical protein